MMLPADSRLASRYLEAARTTLHLTVQTLWVQYLGLGGAAPLEQLRRWLAGVELLPIRDHNFLAQALNDCFVGGGGRYLVPYVEALGP